MTVVYVVSLLMLLAAALMALVRIERGPSMFDRILGLDVITAVLIGTVTIIAAITDRVDLVPVLVVLALVGFIGSVTVARFAAVESTEEGRILTREELDQIMAERSESTDDPDDDDDGDDDDSGTVITAVSASDDDSDRRRER